MSGKIKIVWIDDEAIHEKDARNLEAERKELEIDFVDPSGFEDYLKKLEEDVDLFLVDDRLIRRDVGASRSFGRRGLSVAAQIREEHPEIPIYLFSAYPENYGIYTALAEAAKSFADEIVAWKTIQREGHDLLYHDAMDYRKIRRSPRSSVYSLLNLLNAPENDHKRILAAFPESLMEGLSPISEKESAEGNAIAFAKWAKRIFLELPGFVYDSLYSATKLGITEKTFKDLESKFEDARYNGVFAKTRRKLWWDSKLRARIFHLAGEKLPSEETTNLQELTKKVFSLHESKVAECVVCGEKYPDTVGINKHDEEDRQPVHYRCSEPHPTKSRMLYFEEPRRFPKEE